MKLEHIDRDTVVSAVLSVVDPKATPTKKARQIMLGICRAMEIAETDLGAGCRLSKFATPRQLSMALCYDVTGMSLAEVAGLHGMINHTSTIHARRFCAGSHYESIRDAIRAGMQQMRLAI